MSSPECSNAGGEPATKAEAPPSPTPEAKGTFVEPVVQTRLPPVSTLLSTITNNDGNTPQLAHAAFKSPPSFSSLSGLPTIEPARLQSAADELTGRTQRRLDLNERDQDRRRRGIKRAHDDELDHLRDLYHAALNRNAELETTCAKLKSDCQSLANGFSMLGDENNGLHYLVEVYERKICQYVAIANDFANHSVLMQQAIQPASHLQARLRALNAEFDSEAPRTTDLDTASDGPDADDELDDSTSESPQG
ncbi:hypothetical protein K461DRAFT_296451 [Myriangium duriaei CBS 260.36]|uniref:Uncharacterized protein n=1 Tax=Myriangium duriaei CBS 260.36 TaxID=1168546 RepID=A0A9P4J0B8_9PEZI|nr:hypothetical protein K461DRAFT_296451 [Myriangium duriaei CBS 260.36]